MDHGNGQQIDGRVLKVSYSNHIRRKDFLGDKGEIETTQSNAKTLFLGYHETGGFPTEQQVMEVFSKYGIIKAIYMKQAPPNTFIKSHIFVDYEAHDSADRALYEITSDQHQKEILGDPDLDISYAYLKKHEVISRTKLEPRELCIHLTSAIYDGVATTTTRARLKPESSIC